MIQEHIHTLLFEHDCVIIPDFGGLITHYEPARIHPIKHTFLPPSKRIAFNEKLKLNDGLLISTLAYDKHISSEEAQSRVTEFVRKIQSELNVSRRFELKGIGIFKLNAEQKIEFDYIPSDNFLGDSFGLPELLSRPILPNDAAAGLRTLLKDKQAEKTALTTKPTLRRRVKRAYDMAAVFAITGLTVSALYFLSLQTDYNLSSLNLLSILSQTNNTVVSTPTKSIPPKRIFSEKISPETESITAESTKPGILAGDSLAVAGNVSAIANVNKPVDPIVKDTLSIPVKKEVLTPTTENKPVVVSNTKTDKETLKNKKTEKTFIPLIAKETARYYVIAGGYTRLRTAERSRKYIFGNKKESKIIVPFTGSKLYRVSIADFTTRQEAVASLPVLKNKFGANVWVLAY